MKNTTQQKFRDITVKSREKWWRSNTIEQREGGQGLEDSSRGISVYMRCMLAYQRISDLRNLRILICNLNNFSGYCRGPRSARSGCLFYLYNEMRRIVFLSATHVDKAAKMPRRRLRP